jgi:restriction system protein
MNHGYEGKTEESGFLIFGLLVLALFWRYRVVLADKIRHIWFWSLLALALILSTVLFSLAAKALWSFKHNRLQPSKWESMSGEEFEHQIAVWLKRQGFSDVLKTEYFDQGIDIVATRFGIRLGVQVKRSVKPVGVNAIRSAVAGMASYGCNQAMVVTNSTFTTRAKALARVNNCQLIDGGILTTSVTRLNVQ